MIWTLPTSLGSPHILSSWYYLCPILSLHTPLSPLAHPSDEIDLDRSLCLTLFQSLLCHRFYLFISDLLLLHRPEPGIQPHSLAHTLRILLHFLILYIFAGVDIHVTARKRDDSLRWGFLLTQAPQKTIQDEISCLVHIFF